VASPGTISISKGQSTDIAYKIKPACYTSVTIIQDSDETPTVVPVRTLHGFKRVAVPGETVTWNGLDDAGAPVAPGTYLAQVQATAATGNQLINYAVGRIAVTS
jgi:flagellar hook assembly protein FlgD